VQATDEWVGSFMPADYQMSDVYMCATVDQGGNIVNAFQDHLGILVVLCNAHRLSTACKWALGLAGSIDKAQTCKNPQMRAFIGRLAALVGHFTHASSNNDAFRRVQEQMLGIGEGAGLADEDVDVQPDAGGRVLNLVRRNDTRWGGNHAMCDRLLVKKSPILRYAQSVCLSVGWSVGLP
jgi:hypothetical protein